MTPPENSPAPGDPSSSEDFSSPRMVASPEIVDSPKVVPFPEVVASPPESPAPPKGTYASAFIKLALGGALVAVAAFFLYEGALLKWFEGDYARRGDFGNQFGALTCAFVGVAAFGIIAALLVQARAQQRLSADFLVLARAQERLCAEVVKQAGPQQQQQPPDFSVLETVLKDQAVALMQQVNALGVQRVEMARSATALEAANELAKAAIRLTIAKDDLDLETICSNMTTAYQRDRINSKYSDPQNQLFSEVQAVLRDPSPAKGGSCP
jgi:hypothetical protein